MAPNLKNNVNPLAWNVPISNKDGTPTNEFQRKWGQQASVNSSIPDLTTAAGVSARLDLLGALPGMLLERGATGWGGLASPADATKFLNGAALPAYAAVKDSDLALTDITTNNVSITKHGFAPKAPNDATKFLNGVGAYSTPASGSGGAASIQDDGTNLYVALSDTDGQLVLDGSGDPVFSVEVLPAAAVRAVTGVIDGSNANPGEVGEYTALVLDILTLTPVLNSTNTTLLTKLLQPGDWYVSGVIGSDGHGTATISTQVGWFNVGTTAQPPVPGEGGISSLTGLASSGFTFAIPGRRVSLSVATNIFLVAVFLYSGTGATGFGAINAHRIR